MFKAEKQFQGHVNELLIMWAKDEVVLISTPQEEVQLEACDFGWVVDFPEFVSLRADRVANTQPWNREHTL